MQHLGSTPRLQARGAWALPAVAILFTIILFTFLGNGDRVACAQSTDEDAPPIVVDAPVPPGGERDATAAATTLIPTHTSALESAGALLRDVPGVQLRSEGGFGRRLSLSLRGTDNQQVLVVFDDVPLNAAIGGGFDLSLLDLGGIAALEVYRGGTATFGSGALGGTVRIVPASVSATLSGYAGASVGSFGTAAVRGGASVPWAGGGVRMDWTLRDSAGDFSFVDTNGVPRVRENNDSFGASLRARAEVALAETVAVAASATFHRERRGIAGVEQFPTPHARQDTRFALFTVRAGSREGARISWSTLGWLRDQQVDFRDPTPAFPPPVDNRQGSRQVGAAAGVEGELARNHWLSGRLELGHEWSAVDRSGTQQSPNRTTLAASTRYEWSLLDGAVVINPALRVEWASSVGLRLLPKLGLLAAVGGGLELRANASRSFRLPSFEELYFDAGAVRGNSHLEPEDAWTVDLGVYGRWGWLRAEIVAFFLHTDNLILFLPKTAYVVEADNSGAATSAGLETQLSIAPWPWLGATVGYTLVDARFAATDLQLPARSAHQLSARLEGGVPWLRGWAVVRHQSAFFLDRFESLGEEARTLADAGLVSEPWSTLRVSATVANIFDKRDAVDALQFPLPGRSFVAHVEMTW